MKGIRSIAVGVAVLAATALAGCDAIAPTVAPTAFASKPAVRIDPTWQNTGGQWTFTGQIDPQGDPTDVVLEIGPGPETARTFNQRVPVVSGVTLPAPLTVTTGAIPDIPEICVRFTATNSAGTSLTTPLCFAHDQPSFAVDGVAPATHFSAPAFGSTVVLNGRTYTVTWTETEEGSGIASRSLQRRAAPYAGGACGAYADDGPAVTSPSPVDVTDLVSGKCYEWIETLSDRSGNTSVTTSGTVRVG